MATNLTPKELNELGDSYFTGPNKNIELAYTYYKKAAYLNNPVGYYNVARYFFEKGDYKQALEYFTKAKELNYSEATIKLSEIYLNGLGVHKSKKKAFKFMEQAVKQGNIDAYNQLGQFYLEGIGVRRNEQKAHENFETSANKNNPDGMYLFGKLLLEAKNIKKDYKNGFYYLDKAASAGSREAIEYLKTVYMEGHPYFKKKSQLYMKEMWFYYDELLANIDDQGALERTALTYFEGNEFIKVNHNKSYKYFTRLYNLDNTCGYLGMGLHYLYGLGVEIDYGKAKDYLDVAATRKNPRAMNALGDIYRLGKGVDIDYNRAKDYYFEAAKEDETNSLVNLGLLHYRKQIPNSSNDLAFQYLTRAAQQDNYVAHYWLGIFYDKGIGCHRNFAEAKKHFLIAIDGDNVGALYKYANLLLGNIIDQKLSAKKKSAQYMEIKDLLLKYVLLPFANDTNQMYSMYLLGWIYALDSINFHSDKISRYWFESAAMKGHSKAMVRMYFLLKETEPDTAVDWLKKAIRKPYDGEELYEMGNIYFNGFHSIDRDIVRARELYGRAAGLGYGPAKEKMTMV